MPSRTEITCPKCGKWRSNWTNPLSACDDCIRKVTLEVVEAAKEQREHHKLCMVARETAWTANVTNYDAWDRAADNHMKLSCWAGAKVDAAIASLDALAAKEEHNG